MIKLQDLKVPDHQYLVYPAHKHGYFSQMLGKGFNDLYAIEVKDIDYRLIKANIEKFIKYAKARPTQTFYVTNMGAAIDFAPMLVEAPFNCILPMRYKDIVGVEEGRRFWHS